jgi:hypothetical protein
MLIDPLQVSTSLVKYPRRSPDAVQAAGVVLQYKIDKQKRTMGPILLVSDLFLVRAEEPNNHAHGRQPTLLKS